MVAETWWPTVVANRQILNPLGLGELSLFTGTIFATSSSFDHKSSLSRRVLRECEIEIPIPAWFRRRDG